MKISPWPSLTTPSRKKDSGKHRSAWSRWHTRSQHRYPYCLIFVLDDFQEAQTLSQLEIRHKFPISPFRFLQPQKQYKCLYSDYSVRVKQSPEKWRHRMESVVWLCNRGAISLYTQVKCLRVPLTGRSPPCSLRSHSQDPAAWAC